MTINRKQISDKAVEEVYSAFTIMLEKHPKGVGPSEVHQKLLADTYSVSHVSRVAQYLAETNHLAVRRKQKGRSGKLYALGTVVLRTAAVKARPDKAENPGEPDHWIDDLNRTIDGLERLQLAIPAVKAALLDISRDLGRLAKVKAILAEMNKAARMNI